MTEPSNHEESREQAFDRLVLHDYLEAVERGDTPIRKELIAKHPEFAEELWSFFSDLRNVDAAVGAPRTDRSATNNSIVESTKPDDAVELRTPHFIRDYQLLKKIGEGGMGTVYLAVHTQLEKRVAIKVLKGDRKSDTAAIQRFQKEIKAVGRFEHDHIVRALDAGKIDGLHFLVMEFIDGSDLSQLLNLCHSFSIGDACELTRQAALGLDHAHQKGLIHRDIKPSNLMLTPTGRVKLLDLGLAHLSQPYRQSTALTFDGQALGTLKYMAPEQLADCKSVDATCDIYSLGVTLLELLRGELPANGMQAGVDSESLREIRGDVPSELLELIRSMTTVQPSQRTQSAGEVAGSLAAWVDGHDLTALFTRFRQQSRQSIHPPPAPPMVRIRGTEPTVSHNGDNFGLRKRLLPPSLGVGLFLAAVAVSTAIWPRTKDDPDNLPSPMADAVLDVMIDPNADSDQRSDFSGVIRDESTGETYRLTLGKNQVSPGSYTMRIGDWTSEMPLSFVLEPDSQKLLLLTPPVSKPPSFPMHFPELPRTVGAWARFKAKITPVRAKADDVNADENQQQSQTYEVTLRCLETELVGDRDYRWIQTDIKNSLYHETAYLLVDEALYEMEQTLSIREGFIEADLPEEAADLAMLLGNPRPTVRWNHQQDPLNDFAKDWGFQWPANRISTQSMLTMIFELAHPTVDKQFSELRDLLGSSTRPDVEESTYIDEYGRVIPSVKRHATSDGRSGTSPQIQYTIESAKDGQKTPFSFLRVDISGPHFRVSLNHSVSSLEGSVRSVNRDRLESVTGDLADLNLPVAGDYTRASLPAEEREFAVYKGTVNQGGKTLTVKVGVTAGAHEFVGKRKCRWIEVNVASGAIGNEYTTTETVTLLVDVAAYQDDKEFVVCGGWHELGGETFNFRQGDTKPATDSLAWLGDSPSRNRFNVHEVLSLLFDAKLPSLGPASHLRELIAAADAEDSARQRPKPWRSDEIPGKGRVNGFSVEFMPKQNQGLHYRIGWSEDVPFGFVKVSLVFADQFEVHTELDHFGHRDNYILGSKEEMLRKADATTKKLTEMGVRVWTIEDENMPYLVGKFQKYYEGDVTFLEVHSGRGQEVKFENLSGEDRRCIMQNHAREWRTATGIQVRGLLHHQMWPTIHVLPANDSKLVVLNIPELHDVDKTYLMNRNKR